MITLHFQVKAMIEIKMAQNIFDFLGSKLNVLLDSGVYFLNIDLFHGNVNYVSLVLFFFGLCL